MALLFRPMWLRQRTARAQRAYQVQHLVKRLLGGVSTAAIARMTAVLAQIEEQQSNHPAKSVSIVADIAGYRRALINRNGV